MLLLLFIFLHISIIGPLGLLVGVTILCVEGCLAAPQVSTHHSCSFPQVVTNKSVSGYHLMSSGGGGVVESPPAAHEVILGVTQ